jgi:hypothetical protein
MKQLYQKTKYPFLTLLASLIFLSFGVLYSQIAYAGCGCSFSFCQDNDTSRCSDPQNPDFRLVVQYNGGCTDTDTCSEPVGGMYDNHFREIQCSECTSGSYGDYTSRTDTTKCIQSCSAVSGSDGGTSCQWEEPEVFNCDNREGELKLQAWPTSTGIEYGSPRAQEYSARMTDGLTSGWFMNGDVLAPGIQCGSWFTYVWSGYVNFPPGENRLLVRTDPSNDSSDCSGGKCKVLLGISGSSGIVSPSGGVSSSTGEPVGLTPVIQGDSGNQYYATFTGGWYPIQVQYVVRGVSDTKYFKLSWSTRVPGGVWRTETNGDFTDAMVRACAPPPSAISNPTATLSLNRDLVRIDSNSLAEKQVSIQSTVRDRLGDAKYANQGELWAIKQNANGTWSYSNDSMWQSSGFRIGISATNVFNCSGTSDTCSNNTATWSPPSVNPFNTSIGNWKIAINGFNTARAWCTGNEVIPSGVGDCDQNGNDLKDVKVCGIKPAKPSLIYPTGGLDDLPTDGLTLRWTASSGDVNTAFGNSCYGNQNRYFIELRKEGSATVTRPCGIIRAVSPTGFPATSCQLNNLEPGTTYEWRVKSSNGDGVYDGAGYEPYTTTLWSSFTTASLPKLYDWITVYDGDVYAPAIGMRFPDLVSGNTWLNKTRFAQEFSSIFSGTLNILSANRMDTLNTNIAVTGMGGAKFIDISFVRPEDPETFSPGSLEPGKVYRINNASVLNGIYNSGGYDLSGPGIAVVYADVSGDEILITKNIRHANPTISNERLLLVTPDTIKISKDVGTPNPGPVTSSTVPNIQMGMISARDIIFESGKDGNDSTAIVEGPVAAKGSVMFDRLTPDSLYPGVIVTFNPIYVTKAQEFTNILTDYHVTWEVE